MTEAFIIVVNEPDAGDGLVLLSDVVYTDKATAERKCEAENAVAGFEVYRVHPVEVRP